MARSTLEIVYKLAKQGGADRETLAGLKKVQSGLKEMAVIGGAAVAVGYGIKKAFDFAREGADLEMMRGRMDNLAASVGTTSDALLGDLRTATRGLYSDAQLTASAVDFLSLGFAKSHDEAVRLSAVAAALNMNMNQLSLTLANKTTARFDSLSVSADGFKEKLKEVEESGVSADRAFTEAFLQQAEAQIEKVGHTADTSAGQFLRLDAQWQNFTNSLKMGMAEVFVPLLEVINENVSASQAYYNTLEKVAQASGITVRELRMMREEGDNLVAQYQRAEQYGAAWEKVLGEQAGTLTDVTEAVQDNTAANQDMLGLIFQLQGENDKYQESLDEVNAKFEDGKYVQDLYKQSRAELLADARAGKITWDEYSSSIAQMSESYRDGSFAAEQQGAAVEALAAKHEEASQRIAFSLLQQKAAADGLTNAEFAGLLKVGQQWGIIDEKTAESAMLMDASMAQMAASMQDPKNQLTDLVDKSKNLSKLSGSSFDFYVNIHTSGAFPNIRGTNSGSGAGYENNAGVEAEQFAAGGQLGKGWSMVGEEGFELITPSGYVIPHDISRALMSSGLTPENAFRFGGEGPGVFTPTANMYGGTNWHAPAKKKSPSVSPRVVSKEINNAAQSAQVVAEVTGAQITADAAVQSASTAQQQAEAVAARTEIAISNGNAAMVSELKDVKRLLANQPKQMVSAFIQANP